MTRHSPALAAGAVLCLLATGCGSVAAGESASSARRPGDPGRPALARPAPGRPTATANRRLANSEALRLLSLVRVPAHSVRLSSPPSSLPAPPMGTPGVKSLVDASRSWRLPMSFMAAEKWLGAHPPAGFRRAGEEPSFGPPGSAFSYVGAASAAWESAELDIAVAPASDGGTVMRADAQVVWLDPSPVWDLAKGKRLRVLAAAGCPRGDSGVVGVTNPGPGLDNALVPTGRPSAGLECFYFGLNGRPFELRSQARLGPAQAGRLAASMVRIPLSHPVGAEMSCPMDDGSAELIALSYPGRPDVDLWVYLNGCGAVSNGHITTADQ
jgi:hypothetical protein